MSESNIDRQLFFSEFPSSSKEEWEKIVAEDIGDPDYISKIGWPISGLPAMAPLYTKDEIAHSETLPLFYTGNWQLCEFIPDSNPVKANLAIKEALNGGAQCCIIHHRQSEFSADRFKKVTEDLADSGAELILDIHPSDAGAILNLRSTTPPKISFLVDTFSENNSDLIPGISDSRADVIFGVNSTRYHKTDASIPHQLAVSLSMASELLLTEGQKAAHSILFRLETGPLYFPEIAKLRALRILWHNLLDAYEIMEKPDAQIIAEIKQSEAQRDATNNLLISVSKAMASVLGGADKLLIHPFDAPSGFTNRITRNIQHILRDEAHLNKTADPAAGSYFIEKLTGEIAQEAWKRFGNIEKGGGFLSSLQNGQISEVLS